MPVKEVLIFEQGAEISGRDAVNADAALPRLGAGRVALCIAYAVQVGFARVDALNAATVAAFRQVVGMLFGGWLSDHVGRRPVLAFRSGEWAENFMRNATLTRQTDSTIAERDALRASVEEVRKQGYAVTRGETYDNVGAVSAPVFGADGFLCAIVVAGAVEQVIAKTETLASLARSTADEISVLMGRRAIRLESEPAIA